MRSLALQFVYALAVVLPHYTPVVHSQILPGTSKPSVYHVKIDATDLASSDTFSGSVLVNITVTSSIPYMLIHSKNLAINESSVEIMKKRFSQPRWDVQKYSSLNFSEALLNVTFQSPIAVGEYSFYAEYQGYYQNEMAGFAKVPYHFEHQQKYLGVTAFHPTNSRKVFPCFDDPRYRSDFNLDIVVTRPFIAMSNVRPTLVHNVTEKSRMFSFRNYPSIPVQQLSWAVVDQTSYPLQEDNSTSVVIHTRTPYLYINQTKWANLIASSLLKATGNYTGVSFDQGKFELLVLPEFFSGISEGYGFLSFSEEAALVDPDKSSKKYTQQVTLGLARAIVRQWFGDIVSVDSWQSMWIMSGLSEYLQYVMAADLPEVRDYELEAQTALELTQKGLQRDSLYAHPLSVNSDDETTLVSTVTDDLTKYKGGALMRMLNDIYGNDAFNYGLNTFISASFSKAIANPTNPDLLWNVLYDVATERQVDLAQKSLADIMQPWVYKPGYPVLSISANSTHFIVSQSNNSLWWVPVTYLLSTSTSVSRAWLHPGSEFTIEKSSANWILLNLNQTGFYRVNYTSELWKLLSAQLVSDLTRLPRLSRAQLIDDVFAVAEDRKMALELTGYLRAETDYFPWTTALRHYKAIMYSLSEYPSYPFLQNYLLQLMNGVIAEIGFSPKPQDTYIDKIKRAMVLEAACEFGHQACIQKAVTNLRTWMANTFYEQDLSPALLCAGIANSSSDVWYNVSAMYGYSVYPSIRLELIKSLTCTLDKELLYQLLNNITSTKNPTMNNKDKYMILNTLSSRPFGAHTLLDWLVDRLRAQSNSSEESSTPSSSSLAPATTESSTASPNASTAINSSSINTNQSTTTTELPKAANQSSGTRLTAEASVPTEALPESDVKSIIQMILPLLTTMEAGTKLDSFSALGNKTGLSEETLDIIKSATHQIYMQVNSALILNGKLITWLETEVTTTTTGGSTKPLSPTTSPPQTTTKPAGGSANMPSGTGAAMLSVLTCILLLCVPTLPSLHLYP